MICTVGPYHKNLRVIYTVVFLFSTAGRVKIDRFYNPTNNTSDQY